MLQQYKKYQKISSIKGPLIIVEGIDGVCYDELVKVELNNGQVRLGKVLIVNKDHAVIEVFEGTMGIENKNAEVIFTGQTLQIPVSRTMLGRTLDCYAKPVDNGPMILQRHSRDINGNPLNPMAREYPKEFIQTGISAIDGMNTLIRGQKLPIFSVAGVPQNELAAQIAKQATVRNSDDDFAVVFAAIGVNHDTGVFFRESFERSAALSKVTMIVNYADDPPIERIITPRTALTLAEYLAFECDMHVLVIITDMTNYCEAVREQASSKGEIPSRKGYPGYLYSDLASLYERAGRVKNAKGTITQLPILTMPNDDITHPIPDLTGYITEGQIVLSRELDQKGVYPPINVLPSLSRLMKDSIGKDKTREDHHPVTNQLFSMYAQVKKVESLASIIGEEELSKLDKLFLKFGYEFEHRFVNQSLNENRDIEKTLDIAWELLSIFPKDELNRISTELIEKYYKNEEK